MKPLNRRSFLKKAATLLAVVPVLGLVLPKAAPSPLLKGELGRYEGFKFHDTPKYKEAMDGYAYSYEMHKELMRRLRERTPRFVGRQYKWRTQC